MNTYAYTITTTYVLAMDVVFTLVLMWTLRAAGAPWRVFIAVGAAAAAWLGLLGWAIGGRHLPPAGIGSLPFFFVLLGGVTLVALVFAFTAPGTLLSRGGHEWLLFPQGMRAFYGAGFLVEGALGVMPREFAMADGLTHITSAVLALWTAWMFGRGFVRGGALWLTNVFGLVDIGFVAAGISFVLLPEIGPHHNVMYAAFFAAPVFVALHILSLRLLLQRSESGVREPRVELPRQQA